MSSLPQFILTFLSAFLLLSCSKDHEDKTPVIDRFGLYQGSVILKVTRPSSTTTEPYNTFLEISKGDNDQELKLRFGTQFTRAVLNENNFTIQETIFNIPPRVASGNGEFLMGNKVKINYYIKTDTVTINYSGTLTK
jgi:hypothetical protein